MYTPLPRKVWDHGWSMVFFFVEEPHAYKKPCITGVLWLNNHRSLLLWVIKSEDTCSSPGYEGNELWFLLIMSGLLGWVSLQFTFDPIPGFCFLGLFLLFIVLKWALARPSHNRWLKFMAELHTGIHWTNLLITQTQNWETTDKRGLNFWSFLA